MHIPIGANFFIRLDSSNPGVVNTLKRYEKLWFFESWLAKATLLLEMYLKHINEVPEGDFREMQATDLEKSVQIDSYYTTSVTYYMRCFVEQEGSTKLEIKEVTKDPKMRECHEAIRTLRNDEFVHWKGHRSKISTKFSYRQTGENTFMLGEDVRSTIREKIGPDNLSKVQIELYRVVQKYVSSRREKILPDLTRLICSLDPSEVRFIPTE